MSVLTHLQNTIPDIYRPESNTVILALLNAIAQSDENLIVQANAAKDQLFVKTAGGEGLESIGKSLGVFKPQDLSISDSVFRNLIPNLSRKPKQIKKAFYDTADVFWGQRVTRANITTTNAATFNLQLGDLFKIAIDNGVTQTLKIETGEVTIGVATALEIKTWLSQIKGATVEVLTDLITGDETINIRTNAPGSTGQIEIFTATSIGSGKLEFKLGGTDILDLEQRFVVYNINPNELVIEIPIVVPITSSTLKGSHHFHNVATIESPQPPDNKVWQGSFLFNPSSSLGTFEISSQTSTLTTSITAGSGLTTITVADTSGFTSTSGDLIFEFGRKAQEFPIPFVSILNANTVAIDPNYTFKQSHLSGTRVNVLNANKALIPDRLGSDLAIYLISPASARAAVQLILEKLKAAGIVITFVVLAPKYKYLITSPYV